VLQEAKEKSEIESKQNNQIVENKDYAYLLDSFQGTYYTIVQNLSIFLKMLAYQKV
jgi:hypothetical protein